MVIDQLIAAYTFDNVGLLVASAVTFGIGFWEYIYSFRLVRREGSAPFPIWMHTFYLAHDSSFAVVLFLLASRHSWNWFLTGAAGALVVWALFEIYNLTMAVKVERREIWSPYYGDQVSVRQAVGSILVQLAAFYALVNIFRMYMGEGSFFQWASVTNMVMAAGPGILWARRGSRKGSSVGLAIVILLGTINTFLPTGMFVQALPGIFNQAWFYIAGVVFSGIAFKNLILLAKFPAKTRVKTEIKPIW